MLNTTYINEYIRLCYFSVTTLCVILVLLFLTWLFMKKHYVSEKLSTYECGFEPFNDARKCFSVNYYNYALSFLLFDVELVIIMPALYSLPFFTAYGRVSLFTFIVLMLLSLIYEFKYKFLAIPTRRGQRYAPFKRNGWDDA